MNDKNCIHPTCHKPAKKKYQGGKTCGYHRNWNPQTSPSSLSSKNFKEVSPTNKLEQKLEKLKVQLENERIIMEPLREARREIEEILSGKAYEAKTLIKEKGKEMYLEEGVDERFAGFFIGDTIEKLEGGNSWNSRNQFDSDDPIPPKRLNTTLKIKKSGEFKDATVRASERFAPLIREIAEDSVEPYREWLEKCDEANTQALIVNDLVKEIRIMNDQIEASKKEEEKTRIEEAKAEARKRFKVPESAEETRLGPELFKNVKEKNGKYNVWLVKEKDGEFSYSQVDGIEEGQAGMGGTIKYMTADGTRVLHHTHYGAGRTSNSVKNILVDSDFDGTPIENPTSISYQDITDSTG